MNRKLQESRDERAALEDKKARLDLDIKNLNAQLERAYGENDSLRSQRSQLLEEKEKQKDEISSLQKLTKKSICIS